MIHLTESHHLQALHGELGDNSGGYLKTEDGFISRPVDGEVARVSEHVFAVMHPNGHFDAIYSGDFFKAEIDGKIVNCELIDLGDGRILIVMGEDTEIVDLNSDQSDNTFKIRKVPVTPVES